MNIIRTLTSLLSFSCQLRLLHLPHHEQVVRVLLEKGPNLEKQTTNGSTALILAGQGGHEQVARALIEAGADVNKEGPQGFTALMFACSTGHSEVGIC